MTCAACVRRVEKGLEDLDGVEKAAVNLATEKATVEYDPSLINLERLSEKIRELGYEVAGLEKTSKPGHHFRGRNDMCRLCQAYGIGLKIH
jgi:Cu+-exporting ATPase